MSNTESASQVLVRTLELLVTRSEEVQELLPELLATMQALTQANLRLQGRIIRLEKLNNLPTGENSVH